MVAQVSPTVNGLAEGSTAKTNGKVIRSKNQLRRMKAKQKKAEVATNENEEKIMPKKEESSLDSDYIVYVSEQLDVKDTPLEAFSDVFARFQLPPDETSQNERGAVSAKGKVICSDNDMESEDDSDTEKKPLSKKKQRKMAHLTVAELKQLIKKPEVVEWTDVTAATVPIPIHWSAKRDYLQGKRGIEKPPFQLPVYITDTGIATMRDAVKEKEANVSLKAKTHERVQRTVATPAPSELDSEWGGMDAGDEDEDSGDSEVEVVTPVGKRKRVVVVDEDEEERPAKAPRVEEMNEPACEQCLKARVPPLCIKRNAKGKTGACRPCAIKKVRCSLTSVEKEAVEEKYELRGMTDVKGKGKEKAQEVRRGRREVRVASPVILRGRSVAPTIYHPVTAAHIAGPSTTPRAIQARAPRPPYVIRSVAYTKAETEDELLCERDAAQEYIRQVDAQIVRNHVKVRVLLDQIQDLENRYASAHHALGQATAEFQMRFGTGRVTWEGEEDELELEEIADE